MNKLSIVLMSSLSVFAVACAGSSTSDSAVQSQSTGDLAVALSKTGTIYTDETLTVSASGGTTPYVYSVAEGDGTIDASSGSFTAPSAKGYVTVQATDANNDAVQIRFYVYRATTTSSSDGEIQTSTLSISPSDVEIASTGTQVFTATGGTAPYTYSVVSGSGSMSGSTFSANGGSGTSTVQVTDAKGLVSSANVSLKVYEQISDTSYIQADHKVGLSLHNPSGARYPSLLVWGTGMNNTEIGKNVTCGYNASTGNLSSPCAASISLYNRDNEDLANMSYRGTLKIAGRNKTVEVDFCIRPSEPSRMYLLWKSVSEVSSNNVTYSTYGARIANGKQVRAHFNTVDTDHSAGMVTISTKNAGYRTGETGCPSGFTSSSFVEVAQ